MKQGEFLSCKIINIVLQCRQAGLLFFGGTDNVKDYYLPVALPPLPIGRQAGCKKDFAFLQHPPAEKCGTGSPEKRRGIPLFSTRDLYTCHVIYATIFSICKK
ncbi:MAG: hypothetical protein K9G49_09850 [Taibaiella sp.]|nr:hypothetical protein [Taibaiella sp.]